METENSVDKEKSNKNVSVCSVQKSRKASRKTRTIYDRVAESEVAVLMDMLGDLPMTHIFQEDGLYLDGVVQGIRAFGDNPKAVSKEVFYRDAAKINGVLRARCQQSG